jgi:bifunctional non-homologous end joining protein LigD
MLPTAGRLPTGEGWRFEFKWDGARIVAGVERGRLHMRTRHGNEVADRFPELAGLGAVGDVVLDGELVVLTDDVPDWAAAIRRLRARPPAAATLASHIPATVMAFDVLRVGGEDLRSRPYAERRAILQSLDLVDGWAVPPASADGEAMLATSLEFGLEGVLAKRERSPYRSGRRSRDWIKVRHNEVYDAVVVGWTRRDSGGLTILVAEAAADGTLSFTGRCTAPTSLAEVLGPLSVREPPVAVPGVARSAQWVRPVLEVEVSAPSRTPDGRLRQPRLRRVRLDQWLAAPCSLQD